MRYGYSYSYSYSHTHAGRWVSQGAPKKKKNPTYLLLLRFFEIFRSDFRKYFYGVFELVMQRNGQKTRFKKKRRGGTTGIFFSPSASWQKVSDMDFPKTGSCGVFELPLLR
jgi:hypothetical protein